MRVMTVRRSCDIKVLSHVNLLILILFYFSVYMCILICLVLVIYDFAYILQER